MPRTGPGDDPPRGWTTPPTIDIAIAAAFVLMTVAEAVLSPAVRSPLLHIAVAGPAMGALAWRRQFPLGVAALVIASNVAVNPQAQFSTLLSLVLVAFTVGAETEAPRSVVGLALVVFPFLVVSVLEGLEPSDLAAALVFFVGPWTVGSVLRQRAAVAADALARAARLEQEQEAQAAAAAEQERTRIARELHDIVSHSISVVTIQTQAVRRRLGPEHAKEAADLAAVEATAREALAEMRRLFGVLRTQGEAAALTPQPGLSELERLLEQVRSSGTEVVLSVEGEPYPVPPGVDLAAYRIIQEALTNTLRHSGARRATVTVAYRAATIDIAVEDDGRGLTETAGGGHGLVGVRERVALYGGTVDVANAATGGVRLTASLPVRDDA